MRTRPLEFVIVTAGEDRECPIHPTDLTDAGGTLILKPGDLAAVPYSSNIRRRINAGDLVLVDRAGFKVSDPEAARWDTRGVISRAEDATADVEPPTLTESPPRGKTESVTPRFDTSDTRKER